ncbi:putative F-box-like domain superfamily protein [Helianthus annuus]|uniref:F-box-like domain superfamily protein n=1 Tax=Helianthus annuus TaxID=4232 RepID=A0A9K3DRF7_HELAN|nr:putative F-box-like domain superfamily protein [Helianthus annuus]KAJ0821471.1 putative F-box-like domain superfamily protein [Helianthus annuus]
MVLHCACLLMRLPTELKLKILESVSCVCSELRFLASSDDLGKQMHIKQFGNVCSSLVKLGIVSVIYFKYLDDC